MITTSRYINVYVNDKQVDNNMKSVKAAMIQLQNQQAKMTIGSREYIEQTKKIQQLKAVMDKHKADLYGVQGMWGKMKAGMGNFFSSALGGFATISGAITLVVSGFKKSIDAYAQAEVASKKLEQALISTGNAAGFTKEQLEDEATMLKNTFTVLDDEDIIGGVTNTLLAYTNITGDAFKRTQKAVIDVATAMSEDGIPTFEDLQAKSKLLGKALNDPANAMGVLSKAGIKLNEEEAERIKYLAKHNQMAEAQTLILDAINTRYGGQATAVRETTMGMKEMAKVKIGDVFENIGKFFVKDLPRYIVQGINFFRSLYNESLPFRASIQAVGAIFQSVFDLIKLNFKGMWEFFKTPAMIIKAIVTGNFKQLDNIIVDQGKKMGKLFADTGKDIWNNFSSAFDKTKEGAKLTMLTVGDAAKVAGAIVKEEEDDNTDNLAKNLDKRKALQYEYFGTLSRKYYEFFKGIGDAQEDLATHLDDIADRAAAIGEQVLEDTGTVHMSLMDNIREFADTKLSTVQSTLDGIAQISDQLAQMSAKGSKRARDLAYAAAMADAFGSAIAAFKSQVGIPVVGPILAPIAAAVALAFGIQQANKVKAAYKYERGTDYHPGGMAIVGEKGPELALLPRGTAVIPNHQLPKNFNLNNMPAYANGIGVANMDDNGFTNAVEKLVKILDRGIYSVIDNKGLNDLNKVLSDMDTRRSKAQ